jgi:hypothetical protein
MAFVACSRVAFIFYLKVIPCAFFLSFPRAQQLYRIESLHPPEHTVTAAVLRETTNETLSRMLELGLHLYISA